MWVVFYKICMCEWVKASGQSMISKQVRMYIVGGVLSPAIQGEHIYEKR